MKEKSTYDVIVVGSGISGGWAVKEMTEAGLTVLLLDRGRDLPHVSGYTTATAMPWDLPHRGRMTRALKAKFPIQSVEGNYPIHEANADFWLPEAEQPYVQDEPFDWFRSSVVGGKSLLWGRQVYRWSDLDFEANAREGIAIDWPIRYQDIVPWYAHVERFIGVSGQSLGLRHLPDSVFQPPMPLNCVETMVQEKLNLAYGQERILTIGRVAHITEATEEQKALGRSSCQYRNACSQGCPYGAYFSTQAATLPAAQRTGNLTVRPHSLVTQVLYDDAKNKATGVEVFDTQTKELHRFTARVIFLNASTVATTQILLQSTSVSFPDGLGNSSGLVGKNLMDHHSRVNISGKIPGWENYVTFGRRANGIFIPRYRNVGADKRPYLRGFDFQGGAGRGRGQRTEAEFGADLKDAQTRWGEWYFGLSGWGETLPYEDNTVTLHPTLKDPYGLPQLVIKASIKENERLMREDMAQDAQEIMELIGATDIKLTKLENPPIGRSKHEMGTARMGRDPKSSVLNGFNQVWDCPNVFVTDGAAMTSSGCVNPSLTYMALTARACAYAIHQLKTRQV